MKNKRRGVPNQHYWRPSCTSLTRGFFEQRDPLLQESEDYVLSSRSLSVNTDPFRPSSPVSAEAGRSQFCDGGAIKAEYYAMNTSRGPVRKDHIWLSTVKEVVGLHNNSRTGNNISTQGGIFKTHQSGRPSTHLRQGRDIDSHCMNAQAGPCGHMAYATKTKDSTAGIAGGFDPKTFQNPIETRSHGMSHPGQRGLYKFFSKVNSHRECINESAI